MHFNFIAGDNFELNSLNDIEKFLETYPDFQTVVLANEDELNVLLELMGINEFLNHDLESKEFSKYWNLSDFRLPEFNDQQFEQFYKKWLTISRRDNNMDEYCSLIFLQGLSKKWNILKYRLVLLSRI